MKIASITVALLACAFCTASTDAQDEQDEHVQESVSETVIVAGAGEGTPMIFSSSSTLSGDGVGMRIMSTLPGAFGGGDFAMPAPNPFDMLGNPSVQKDLELVGDQLDKVKAIQREFQQQLKDKIGNMSSGLSKDSLKDIPAMLEKLRTEQQEQLKGLLLPHQIDRLRQVALQTHMKQAGAENAIASKAVAEALNITDDQKAKLKEKAKELKKKLEEDIKKLREESKQELLGVLSADQRKTLEELTGPKYEPNNEDWKESFNQRFRSQRSQQKKN